MVVSSYGVVETLQPVTVPVAPRPDLAGFLQFLPEDMRKMVQPTEDPCDDFHEYACGAYEEHLQIPGDKSGWAYSWDGDAAEISTELKAMMSSGDMDPKVEHYFQACSDEALVEKLGIEPVKPYLDEVAKIKDMKSLAAALSKWHKGEIGAWFDWWLSSDSTDPSRVMLMIDQGGLDLPDSTYYTDNTTESRAHMEVYRSYIVGVLKLYGHSEAEAAAMRDVVIKMEQELASHVADDNALVTPPRYNVSGLVRDFPNFDWVEYFAAWGHSDIATTFDQIIVISPKWLTALDKMLKSYSIADIRTYMLWHMVFNVGPLLGTDFFKLNLELDHSLYGVTTHPPRWKKCVGATKAALPMLVSKAFVAKYFPPSSRAIAATMLENIRNAFHEDLLVVPWMNNSTRQAALEKLRLIFIEVGYPSKWPEYHFEVTNTTYFQNSMLASEWRTADKFERLRHPTDRHRWTMSPATVNAYYDNGVNGVFVPAGLLQDPFFSTVMPIAHSYGSAGAIMAHELTHGFDNSGRKYDAHSRQRQWWDKNTIAEFETRANCIADLYNGYKIVGTHVDGNSTLGENIADIGGVKMAHNAWVTEHKRVNNGTAPPVDEKRMFFLSFAQSWCGVNRKRVAKLNILTDVHSPDKFRIIGPLSQNPEFAEAFQCKSGSMMNPAKRCVLW